MDALPCFSLPPSKIFDFCHLPRQREALGGANPRLPLMRELSAQLTEGEIIHSQIYVFAYTAKIAVNIQVANPDYC